jgi:hypothetical protein
MSVCASDVKQPRWRHGWRLSGVRPISLSASWLVRGGGQGRDRTADLSFPVPRTPVRERPHASANARPHCASTLPDGRER